LHSIDTSLATAIISDSHTYKRRAFAVEKAEFLKKFPGMLTCFNHLKCTLKKKGYSVTDVIGITQSKESFIVTLSSDLEYTVNKDMSAVISYRQIERRACAEISLPKCPSLDDHDSSASN
jgi:hypothetical protein